MTLKERLYGWWVNLLAVLIVLIVIAVLVGIWWLDHVRFLL